MNELWDFYQAALDMADDFGIKYESDKTLLDIIRRRIQAQDEEIEQIKAELRKTDGVNLDEMLLDECIIKLRSERDFAVKRDAEYQSLLRSIMSMVGAGNVPDIRNKISLLKEGRGLK